MTYRDSYTRCTDPHKNGCIKMTGHVSEVCQDCRRLVCQGCKTKFTWQGHLRSNNFCPKCVKNRRENQNAGIQSVNPYG